MFKRIMVFVGFIAVIFLASCSTDSSSPPTATLTLVNDSNHTLTGFWASLSTDVNWGPNLMASPLLPGESKDFTIPAGEVDLSAESETNDLIYYWDTYSVTINNSYTWGITDDKLTGSY